MKKPKTERIDIRVSKDKKEELKRMADKARLTISALIMNRIENLPLKDYEKENEFLLKLNELTQQFGYIGKNINQATIAIHQIKNTLTTDGRSLENEPINEFNNLMRQYLETTNELRDNLKKIYFS